MDLRISESVHYSATPKDKKHQEYTTEIFIGGGRFLQLKGFIYPNMLKQANGANSSVARSSTTSLDSFFGLSRVSSVSPLNSKARCALSFRAERGAL